MSSKFLLKFEPARLSGLGGPGEPGHFYFPSQFQSQGFIFFKSFEEFLLPGRRKGLVLVPSGKQVEEVGVFVVVVHDSSVLCSMHFLRVRWAR